MIILSSQLQPFKYDLSHYDLFHDCDLQALIEEINIECVIQQLDTSLVVGFNIQIPSELQKNLSLQKLTNDNQFTDYLWQDSCLECFIGKQDCDDYIEINVSFNGQFAVYHFDDYRIPASLPPRRLMVEKNQPATIQAIRNQSKQSYQLTNKPQWSFNFDLTQLPDNLADFDLINPSVILFLTVDKSSTMEKLPLFYSLQHEKEADFHNKDLWQLMSVEE